MGIRKTSPIMPKIIAAISLPLGASNRLLLSRTYSIAEKKHASPHTTAINVKVTASYMLYERKTKASNSILSYRRNYSCGFSSFTIVIPNSAIASAGTSAGQSVISSFAFCILGNATTSRKLVAPTICIIRRSRPIPIPP